jgi:hypothetical protein
VHTRVRPPAALLSPTRPFNRRALVIAALAVAVAAGGRTAGAQRRTVAAGDALLRAGRVEDAERVYYAAATRRPRDPAARLALGRYLASRGALRGGAVLLEEARYCGGDSAAVARELVPVYGRLNDQAALAALAALPRSPLSPPERERAEWLRDHPSSVVGDDSVVVPFTPAPPGGTTVGTFGAVIGGAPVTVVVDGALSGWVLDPTLGRGRGTRLFGGAQVVPGRTVAIADVRVGGLSLVQLPVRFAVAAASPTAAGRDRPLARVGLDALGAFAPTFDARTRRLVLRTDGRAGRGRRAEPVPALLSSDGVYVPAGDALVSLVSARGREVVPQARRWTYDRRRGTVLVER